MQMLIMKLQFSFATTFALYLNRISVPHDTKYEIVAVCASIMNRYVDRNEDFVALNILLFKKKKKLTNEDRSPF